MKRAFLLVLLLGSLAVGQGQRPWFIGMDGGVYRALERVGLGSGTCLTVIGDTAYLVGMDQRVWTSGPGGDWQVADQLARATRVAAASDGAVFLLGTDSGVYQMGVGRVGLGLGSDLAVGAGHDLFVVGTDSRVWWSDNASGNWRPYNQGTLVRRVGAGADGTVAIIGLDAGVYLLDTRNFQRLGMATAQSLDVTSDGTVYIVGLDNAVYFYRGGQWQRLGQGLAKQVVWPR